MQKKYSQEVNDLTPEVVQNLNHLGIDHLIPIGGDDTLSYAARLHKEGFQIVAIPKTMDNDLPLPGRAKTYGYATFVKESIRKFEKNICKCGANYIKL